MSSIAWAGAVVLILAGVAGTVLPALPGTPLVFLGLLLGAWLDNFQRVGGITLSVLAVLTILTFVADLIAVAYGAKKVDASRQALVGATLGTLIGLFTGFAGLVIGPFIGGAVGEWMARRDVERAGKVGFTTWISIILASAAKLALTFLMIGLFIVAYLW